MFESKINRGKANGYAPLDGSGKVPLDKLPPIQSTIDTGSFLTNEQTGSFATTDSNEFNGNQTINGIIQGTGSLYLKADSNDSRYFEIYNTSPSDTHIKASSGISFFGDDTNYIKIDNTTDDVTIAAFSDIILDADDGGVYIGSYGSGNGVLTNGYLDGVIGDTNMVNNGTGNTITDNLTNIINSIPAAINTSSLATTGSNIFNGNQSISGSVSISASLVVASSVVSNGTIDALNSDLIIEGGYLILTASAVPTSSTGSIGDVEGMIVMDNNFLYRCTADYIPETYQITVSNGITYNTHVTIPKNQPGVPNLYSGGFSITTQDDTTYVLTGVYTEGNNWDCEIDGLNSNYNGGTQTMTLTWLDWTANDIWRRIAFESGSW